MLGSCLFTSQGGTVAQPFCSGSGDSLCLSLPGHRSVGCCSVLDAMFFKVYFRLLRKVSIASVSYIMSKYQH